MKSKTWLDPRVEETPATRSALFEECQYDLAKLHQMILQSEKRHEELLVSKESLSPSATS